MTSKEQNWLVIGVALFFGPMMLYVYADRERENCERAITMMGRYISPAELQLLRERWDTEQEMLTNHPW